MAPQETNLYYLQSRYYDPEVGRFINADAFVSTGKGFIGNNMFTYCGNNPILYIDATGYDYSTTTARKPFFCSEVSHTYEGKRKRYYPTQFSDTILEMQEIETQLDEADSIEDYISIGKQIIAYEVIADPLACYKIPSGIRKMKNGLLDIVLPIPTYADEITGAVKIAWGFYSLALGIGELFDWDGE